MKAAMAIALGLAMGASGREQVNFQVPYEVAGRTTAAVVVTRAGQASAAVEAPVLELQPAIYTLDGSNAILVHADYTLVTAERPLNRGEYAFLYASGLGAVTNRPATGAAAPGPPNLSTAQADVRITIGGLPADVQYAGLAPGYAGVYQVNFRVTETTPSGVQDILLSAGAERGSAMKAPVR